MLNADDEIALSAARELISMGVPVFAARPALTPSGERDWTGGTGRTGYILPHAWEKTVPTLNWLDPTAPGWADKAWRPGWALAAVMGHGLDLLDIDPRNGGVDSRAEIAAAGTWPKNYGVAATPSGGLHEFVANLGIRSRDDLRPGLDVKAGTAEGGRGFAFIAPTVKRSKVTGELAPYGWIVPPRRPDAGDASGAGIAALVAERRASTSESSGAAERIGSAIPSGAHDSTLAAYAATMAARGLGFEEVVALVVARGQDCEPPWGGPDSLEHCARSRWVPSALKKFAREWEEPLPDSAWPAWYEALQASAEGQNRTDSGTVLPAVGSKQRRLTVVSAADIRMRSSRWLWADAGAHWLPLGALTLLGGREGLGKSTWAYHIAAQVTRGILPGDLYGEARAVIICATEDAWAQTVIPRLAAAGADLNQVFRVEAIEQGVEGGLVLPVDVAALTEVCREKRAALILLDPLLGTIHGRLDSHKDAEVRQALEPISRLAHDIEATIIGLIHQNKGSGDLLTRLMGSRAFAAVARAILVCAEEKDVPNSSEDAPPAGRRTFLFGQEKNSLAALVATAFRYEIKGAKVGWDWELDKEIWSSRIEVVATVEERVGDLVARIESESTKKGRPPTKREAAASWLQAYLTAQPEKAASFRAILAAAFAADHEEHNLRSAAKQVGVQQTRMPDMSSIWRLPA